MIDVSKCCITKYPAPVLAMRAKEVEVFDDSLKTLAEKMKDIMVETKGVGLAAPQTGLSLRVFVASPDGSKENAKTYVNPTITPSGNDVSAEEGCLSIPGVYGKIRRCAKCSIKAQDLDGNEFTEEAEGLLARIFQHEYDHLEGIVVADKLSSIAKISAKKKLKKLREQYQEENS